MNLNMITFYVFGALIIIPLILYQVLKNKKANNEENADLRVFDESTFYDDDWSNDDSFLLISFYAVSYTHLTLPTIA